MKHIKSLQLQAYEYIKAKILNGELEFDQMYSETKIAKEMGVSRTPMRDAVQYLAQERYIDIIPNRGFCLHRMEEADFLEMYQIRCAIEGYCAGHLASNVYTPAGQAVIAQLSALVSQMEAALTQPVAVFFEIDQQFHSTLVHHIHNQELSEMFDSYLYRMRKFALESLSHPGRKTATLQEHQAILQAIQSGKSATAYEATLFHMDSPKELSLHR